MTTLAERLASLSPERREVLARCLAQERQGRPEVAPPLEPRSGKDGRSVLSLAQERLWFVHQLDPGTTVYNLPTAVGLEGELDVAALSRALRVIVGRHASLRTYFAASPDGSPEAITGGTIVPLVVVDLTGIPEGARAVQTRRLVDALQARPFDLGEPPFFRLALLRHREREHLLTMTIHHIVSDVRSTEIFFGELVTAYSALRAGKGFELPRLPVQYGDYAEWQRRRLTPELEAEQLDYWKRRLRGAPTTLALPAVERSAPAGSRRIAKTGLRFGSQLVEGLEAVGRREGATLFMTLLAAFGGLLCWYTKQKDLLIASPIMNRNREELQHLIGFFLNTLVLRLDLSGDPSFRGLIGRAREECLAAYGHSDVPFQRVVTAVRPEREANRLARSNPLSEVTFALAEAGEPDPEIEGLRLTSGDLEPRIERDTLVVELGRAPAGLEGVVTFRTEAIAPVSVRRLMDRFGELLEAVVEDPALRLGELSAHLDRLDWDWRARRGRDVRERRMGQVKNLRRKPVAGRSA